MIVITSYDSYCCYSHSVLAYVCGIEVEFGLEGWVCYKGYVGRDS